VKRITIAVAALATVGLVVYFILNIWLQPTIELVGISSDSIVSLRDTLAINLKFNDRDGDIGDSLIGTSNIYVEDTAYHVLQEFPILSRSATHTMAPATGKLKILVPLLPLLDTSVSRVTKLKIHITDRNGHKSNEVITPSIHLSKGGA
jgi:hypothetical protein